MAIGVQQLEETVYFFSWKGFPKSPFPPLSTSTSLLFSLAREEGRVVSGS